MYQIRAGQKGFTLVELLIAIPISALVLLAAAGAIMQLVHSTRATAKMNAIRQVQTAGTWISRDGLQAQKVVIDSDPATDNLCTFVWHNDTVMPNEDIVVSYELRTLGSGLSELQRCFSIVVAGGSPSTTITTVARNLVGGATALHWNDDKTSFNLEVASVSHDGTVSRTYEVTPRPAGAG